MAGSRFGILPISIREVYEYQRVRRFLNTTAKYAGVGGVVTLAAESLYRNLGGDPTTAHLMFSGGVMASMYAGFVGLVANVRGHVSGPEETATTIAARIERGQDVDGVEQVVGTD